MIGIAVVGYGYWGPNLVRNFWETPGARVVSVCDLRPERLGGVQARYPAVEITGNYDEVLADPRVDVVAVATPVSSHFELARRALSAGKHVFIEKPMTTTTAQAVRLLEIADERGLVVGVDHTFIYTGAIRKMRELVEKGELGEIYYYDSTRVNLGMFQHDVNVIWDLAPHDLSIIDHLIGLEPELVVATGGAHLNSLADVAYITLSFPRNIIAHVNVNWLSPVKVRTTLVGGQRKMLVWDDLQPAEKVRVYDKGVNVSTERGVYQLLVSYRSGDMWAPRLEETEALQLETRYFLDCIATGQRPLNDGRAGLRVVRMLEAADQSLKRHREVVFTPHARRRPVRTRPRGTNGDAVA